MDPLLDRESRRVSASGTTGFPEMGSNMKMLPPGMNPQRKSEPLSSPMGKFFVSTGNKFPMPSPTKSSFNRAHASVFAGTRAVSGGLWTHGESPPGFSASRRYSNSSVSNDTNNRDSSSLRHGPERNTSNTNRTHGKYNYTPSYNKGTSDVFRPKVLGNRFAVLENPQSKQVPTESAIKFSELCSSESALNAHANSFVPTYPRNQSSNGSYESPRFNMLNGQNTKDVLPASVNNIYNSAYKSVHDYTKQDHTEGLNSTASMIDSLQQDKPSRYLLVGNLPSHVPYHSMRLFEDGSIVRAVYAGALLSSHIVIAAFFDLRYARLYMKDLQSRSVGGNLVSTTFCSPKKLASIIKDSEPGFITINEGAIEVKGFDSKTDQGKLQNLLTSIGHLRNAYMQETVKGQSLVAEYFDIRDAAKACDQLNGVELDGATLNVGLLQADLIDTSPSASRIQRGRPSHLRISNEHSNDNSHHSVNNNSNSPLDGVRESIFLRREQQRLIEADKTALLKHQVPVGNEINLWRIVQGNDMRTTCMIRNIPNKYTQQMLLDTVNSTHHGEFDFFYLRMDFRNHCNVGYAFINFVDVKSVISFAQKHVGRKWNKFGSDKVCRLSYANIQGRQALIDKFRNSAVMEKDATYRPKIFFTSGPHRGQEESFPRPSHGGRRNSRDSETDKEHWAGAKTAMTALGLLEAEEELEWMDSY